MGFDQMALNLEKEVNRDKEQPNHGSYCTLRTCINGQNIGGFDQFFDLDSVVYADDGTEFDITRLIYCVLSCLFYLKYINANIKLKLFRANILPLLLYVYVIGT